MIQKQNAFITGILQYKHMFFRILEVKCIWKNILKFLGDFVFILFHYTLYQGFAYYIRMARKMESLAKPIDKTKREVTVILVFTIHHFINVLGKNKNIFQLFLGNFPLPATGEYGKVINKSFTTIEQAVKLYILRSAQ